MNGIWGMLTLGAAGSILGTAIFILTKKTTVFLFPIISNKIKKIFVSIYLWIIKKAIDEHLTLFSMKPSSKHHAYYSSLVAKILISLFVSSWLIYGAIVTYGSELIWVTIGFISISLLFIGSSIRSYLSLSAAWIFDFEAKVEESANEVIKNIVKKELP